MLHCEYVQCTILDNKGNFNVLLNNLTTLIGVIITCKMRHRSQLYEESYSHVRLSILLVFAS
jgi:hypothetical protein